MAVREAIPIQVVLIDGDGGDKPPSLYSIGGAESVMERSDDFARSELVPYCGENCDGDSCTYYTNDCWEAPTAVDVTGWVRVKMLGR